MVDDLMKDFRSVINDRITNPLVFSFLVSWSLVNYEFVMILCASGTVENTLYLIKRYSFPEVGDYFISGFLVPLISSLIYVFVLPYPTRYVHAYLIKQQLKQSNDRNIIEKNKMLSIEESNDMRLRFYEREIVYRKQIQDLTEQVDVLTSKISQIQLTNSNVEELNKEGFGEIKGFSSKIPLPMKPALQALQNLNYDEEKCKFLYDILVRLGKNTKINYGVYEDFTGHNEFRMKNYIKSFINDGLLTLESAFDGNILVPTVLGSSIMIEANLDKSN